MKTSIIAIIFFITTFAIPQNDITSAVVGKLKAGNSSELATYFAPKIDLAVPGVDDVYSSAQAELILKKFFASNKPTDMELVHQGISKLGVQYRIGTLTTAKGTFRVSFHMKNQNDKLFIQALRIEASDDDDF